MKGKAIILTISLVLVLGLTTVDAQAHCRRCFNPLFLPFVAVGAAIGTAAAVTTAIVPPPAYAYPVYGGPVYHGPAGGYYAPRPYYARPVWIPPHYNRYGAWIPGHWR